VSNILETLKNNFHKLRKLIKCNNTKIIPVLFNNTPISDGKENIFNFKEQVKILDSAIKNRSTLIGIIGDYGSGKSSLTELCQKKLKLKYGQAIRINMWDTIEKDNEGNGFRFLMCSFLYQLAQGNEKRTLILRDI
jgi:predicted ABC-type transport system involved in lysophospholipase L1 biosynthesis ATPase subunit